MAYGIESAGARQVRYIAQHPEYINKQPWIKLPQILRTDVANTYKGPESSAGVYTTIHYQIKIPHPSRLPTMENRQTILLAASREAIATLAATQPEFQVPQFGFDRSAPREEDWKTFIWFTSQDKVFSRLEPDDASNYFDLLKQSQTPWVDLASFGEGRGSTLSRISAENTAYIQKLAKLQPREPLDTDGLRDAADKYHPQTDYEILYPGMLLDLINLPRSDLFALALLPPIQRAEFLAIDKLGQSKYLQARMNEGFRELEVKSQDSNVRVMSDWHRRLITPVDPNSNTSNNDMEQRFIQMGEGKNYLQAVKDKLVFAANLPSAEIVTLAAMDPIHRLATLINEDALTKDALAWGETDIRTRLVLLPEHPVNMWMDVDSRLQAA